VQCCGRIPTFQKPMPPESSGLTSEMLVSYYYIKRRHNPEGDLKFKGMLFQINQSVIHIICIWPS
jgi:hypothetical protein